MFPEEARHDGKLHSYEPERHHERNLLHAPEGAHHSPHRYEEHENKFPQQDAKSGQYYMPSYSKQPMQVGPIPMAPTSHELAEPSYIYGNPYAKQPEASHYSYLQQIPESK